MDCPKGYIRRGSYKRKSGKRVKSKCIKDVGRKGKASSIKKKKRCSKGKILRDGYYRKAYTRKDGIYVRGAFVQPKCIKDRGRPGKGKKLYKIRDVGMLSNMGYSLKKLASDRRKALMRAIKKYGYLDVIQHLNGVRNVTSKVDRKVNYNKLSHDLLCIRKAYVRYKNCMKNK